MERNLVSVVMPAYNAEAYIRAALASVLQQTCAPLEIIVVDDGSTDTTVEQASTLDARVTVLQHPHKGIYFALNHGIRAARGEWLAFNDSDDLWTMDSLAYRLAAFRADEPPDLVFGHVQNFYSPETDSAFRASIVCPPMPLQGINYYTLLVRREDFLRVGYFDESWLLGNFMEWLNRPAALPLKQATVPQVVLERRLHPHNTGLLRTDARQDYARVAKTLLARKRAADQS